MGTKGSYDGGGGHAGDVLRDELGDWLAGFSGSQGAGGADESNAAESGQGPSQGRLPQLSASALLPALGLFRPGGSSGGQVDGPGGAGGADLAGVDRTVAQSSGSAGRAGAAAYAYRTGDSETLEQLGLSYDQLQASGDVLDVVQEIVAAACGQLTDGTIEDEERRRVAAEIAQWVLEADASGAAPQPEEIVREAIAQVIFEAALTETAAKVREGNRSQAEVRETERQIKEAAQVLAQRAELSPSGPTPDEFTRSIADGIDVLRSMWEEAE